MLTNEMTRLVAWGDCGPSGIVSHSRYMEYFDHATDLLLVIASGLSKVDLLKVHGILGYPIVKAEVQFHAPARFGDQVMIRSEVSGVGHSSFDVRHRLYLAGALRVDEVDTRVWACPDPARPDAMRACAIPAPVAERLRGKESKPRVY